LVDTNFDSAIGDGYQGMESIPRAINSDSVIGAGYGGPNQK